MDFLFLDDVRKPYDKAWVVVRSYDEFVKYIEENGVPDTISFDHDLSHEHYQAYLEGKLPEYDQYKEKTGHDCAKYLIDNQKLPKLAIIHSLNPVGSQRIYNLLQSHCETLIIPFGVHNKK